MALTPPARARLALTLAAFAFLPLRVYAALRLDYGDSEALYASYVLHPQASYRDHPGLIGLLGRMISETSAPAPFLLHFVTAFALSALPFVAFASARACGATPERAPIAGLALVAAPEISVGLFGWTPDLPLSFVWLSALGLGGYLARRGPRAPHHLAAFAALGLCDGLAATAKASGALLALALALTLASPRGRPHLRRPGPWVALALCLLVVSPVVAHELARGLPMLRHRFVDTQARAGLSFRNLGAFVGGQLGYVSPPLFAGALLAARSLRVRAKNDPVDEWLLHATIVPALALGALCLWSRVAEPHWFAPALLALPIAEARSPAVGRRLARWALGVGFALSAFVHVWVLTDLAPRTLGRLYVPRYDLANDMRAWRQAMPAVRGALSRWRYDELSSPIVLAPHWTLAAQIAAGLGPDATVGTLGGGSDDFGDWLPADAWRSRPWVVWVNDDRRPFTRPPPLDAWPALETRSVVVERAGRPVRRVVIEVLGRPDAPSPAEPRGAGAPSGDEPRGAGAPLGGEPRGAEDTPLRDEQRGAEDAGRVAELGPDDGRREFVGEDVARERGAALVVEQVEVGHAAAEHDDVGVDDGEHVAEGTAEGVDELAHDGRSVGVGRAERRHLDEGQLAPRAPLVRRFERRPREVGFDAARAPAVARPPALWHERVVAPLAPHAVRALPRAPPQHEPAADAGAENDAEDHALFVAPGRAPARFGEREAVGVVGERDRRAQRGAQIVAERPPVEAGGVRIFDQTAAPRQRARHAHPDRRGRRKTRLGDHPSYQVRDALDDRLVAPLASRRRPAAGHDLRPARARREHHGLDLRPSEVDADDATLQAHGASGIARTAPGATIARRGGRAEPPESPERTKGRTGGPTG